MSLLNNLHHLQMHILIGGPYQILYEISFAVYLQIAVGSTVAHA
jgi:hypothetical protein